MPISILQYTIEFIILLLNDSINSIRTISRKILYIDANEENNVLPLPNDSIKCDIIYICSPNNPTGAVYNMPQLSSSYLFWVQFINIHHTQV